jgi:hypothetical protein
MLDKEEQWSQTVIAKIVEMFGNPHDCTLADEKPSKKLSRLKAFTHRRHQL